MTGSPPEPIIFVNGDYVPQSQARISVLDHAVLYGDGVFETAVAWNGVVFELEAHLDRLFRSLAAICLDPPYTRSELAGIVLETIRRNGLENAYVKLIVTRGVNDQPLLDPTGCVPGIICFARPYLYMANPDRVRDGLRVKTAATRRPPAQVLDPHIKSLNYLNLVLAKLEARAAGADEALLLDIHGHVCEAPGYNVFAVRDGRIRTPWQDILEGITRNTVMSLARDAGIEVLAETIELYDLYTANEVFFCSTAGGLLPVVEIDGRRIGDGHPGRVFSQLRDGYQRLLATGDNGTRVDA
ncbi:branched-chain-amino-acid transaminase [Phytohabitans aurantiacus]|uniref:Branched-chain-amino-acid aminotransferase n=1 Tax=Phytohabitans aurantiacus TaxID=3016789 RepID=A0ABQ5RBW1_9ACTN|nr:branched-chain-amino-acid transaminase [Phytohabitans aurantiacus]GLI03865.1 branched chain amino acid aminotransferase [Phytohabitans aurantiacus]